eukprot:4152989-Alexandrium_andersonii.AAC.1
MQQAVTRAGPGQGRSGSGAHRARPRLATAAADARQRSTGRDRARQAMTAASAGRYLLPVQGDTCCVWGLQPKGARTAAAGVAIHMQ